MTADIEIETPFVEIGRNEYRFGLASTLEYKMPLNRRQFARLFDGLKWSRGHREKKPRKERRIARRTAKLRAEAYEYVRRNG